MKKHLARFFYCCMVCGFSMVVCSNLNAQAPTGPPSTPGDISGFWYSGMIFNSNFEYHFSTHSCGATSYEWLIGGAKIEWQSGDYCIVTTDGPFCQDGYLSVSVRGVNSYGASNYFSMSGLLPADCTSSPPPSTRPPSPNPFPNPFPDPNEPIEAIW